MPYRNRVRNIAVPSRGAGRSIPSGFLVGRSSKGQGRLELLDLNDLLAAGVGVNKAIANATASLPGFQFFVGGQPGANEQLGSAPWGHTVVFDPANFTYTVSAQVAATSTTVLFIKVFSGGTWVEIGTITFAPGGTVGVVAFLGVETIPGGELIGLFGPASMDATLAGIGGVVRGANG